MIEHEGFTKKRTDVPLFLLSNKSFEETILVFKRFWFLLKPLKSVLVYICIGSLIYTLLSFSLSIYIQKLTDYIFVSISTKLLNPLGAVMILLLVLKLTVGAFKDVFLIKTRQQIDSRLVLGYYKHLSKLPQQFFDKMKVDKIISNVNNTVFNFVFNILILSFSFSFGLMFIYYWKLALIMLAITLVFVIIHIIINKLNKNYEGGTGMFKKSIGLKSRLTNIEDTYNFRYENVDKIETRFISLLKRSYRLTLTNIFSGTSSETIVRLFTIILLWSGFYFVLQKEITAGELMALYAIIGYFTNPITSLISSNKQIQNALITVDHLFEVIGNQSEDEEQKIIFKKKQTRGIHFSKVAFKYSSGIQVFKELDLHIPSGKITAIIGESGSGKSTLVSLLQNRYPIQKGKISIEDQDLKDIDNNSLRGFVSVVPQEVKLFTVNVIENIAVGEFIPDVERIIAICKSIGILEFIESLPNGFNTYLGENGVLLSRGQKQCIAIARALYKNPEILILDEATSSLDSTLENNIKDLLQDLRNKNKTIIIIAHRLSSVINADKIIVLEKGKVIEQGNHEVLYASQAKYYDLWQKQIPVLNPSSVNVA